MIIGVMSDTHGNRVLMHRVAERMVSEHHVDVIFHLGDDYADGEELRSAGCPVRGVPGLWCKEYHNPQVPNTIVEDFGGIRIACAHADQDVRGAAARAAIILTGHTHESGIRKTGKAVRLNPGHLKAKAHRGRPASYALITLRNDAVHLAIHDLDGRVRLEQIIPKAELLS